MLNAAPSQKSIVRGNDGRLSYIDNNDESPLRRAKRLRLSLAFATLPPTTKHHVSRVTDATRLTPPIADVLDTERAPFLVCRWVAEGRWLQDRAVRLALALMMRKPGRSPTGWAWPHDRLFRTAEKHFWKTPQAERLVRLGVLAEQGSVPAQGGPKFSTLWTQTWTTIQREFSTIDRAAFVRGVEIVIAQRQRRRVRKRLRLTDEERAYVEALKTLQRGIIRGKITLDEAGAALHQPEPLPSKKKKKKRPT